MSRYLVTGAGPVARHLARRLAALDHDVIMMSRTPRAIDVGKRVGHRVGDASNVRDYPEDIAGIAHCIHAKYDAKTWRSQLIPAEKTALGVAAERDIPIVFPESVYGFEPAQIITPETPVRRIQEGKPGVRAELLGARRSSPAQARSVVASDLYGPDAGPGCVYHQLIIDKTHPMAPISAHVPHAVTYLPDFARALADALLAPRFPEVTVAPTAPAVTQSEFAALAGSPRDPFVISPWMLRVGGLVSSDLRGLVEMTYLWQQPLHLDGAIAEWGPTPLREGIRSLRTT